MSILTSYRPNFCCECGDKIVRLRWSVWTSRRFCDKCFRALARAHWLRPAVTVLVFFLGAVLLGRGCRNAPAPLIIERPLNAVSGSASGTNASGSRANSSAAGQSTPSNANASQPPVEQLYSCGARTKKGTPCSRRVHGPVRCWQHKGASAMLAQEKLLIKE
jgi:hypothetical protein